MDKATVARIATLARIRVGEGDLERLAGELGQILHWVETLESVDTEGVEPMTGIADARLPRRPDAVTDGDCREAVLANAPDREDGFFAVPRVVE